MTPKKIRELTRRVEWLERRAADARAPGPDPLTRALAIVCMPEELAAMDTAPTARNTQLHAEVESRLKEYFRLAA
jgi:hypothetical protein